MHLGLISELTSDYWIGVFLDSNTIRYLKFHEKLQNLCIFEKMYGKNCSAHSKIGQNFDRKKNVRLYFGLNQKFLLYKLCRMIVKTTCIEAIFDLG